MDNQKDKILRQEERKEFDFLGENPNKSIESTSEYPIMYRALNSERRTEHPFNVYKDIRTEPTAVRNSNYKMNFSVHSHCLEWCALEMGKSY